MKRLIFVLALSLTATVYAQIIEHVEIVRRELMEHYSNPSDSLKRIAANFLLDNMDGHGFVDFELQDTLENVIPFDVLSFATFEALEDSFRAMEDEHGVLDFKRSELIDDDSVITAEFLIDHIDFAFRSWNERPWARGLSFSQFCEYVLPYRGSNEPLEAWRGPLFEQFDSLKFYLQDSLNPIEAAAAINRDLMTWFRFDPRFYYHPADQSLSDMRQTRIGRCEDMTNLSIFAMRANGLAVTSDYTPYWANSGNNHAWNAIVIPSGEVIPFMGAEANPGDYHLANKLAKVYRKTFAVQKNNLAFQVEDRDKLPGYLASKSYTDVTKDYVPVATIDVTLNGAANESFAYLCVFNSGEWKPIQWGRVDNSSVAFADMGLDIAYLPGYYVEKEIVPAGVPFILNGSTNRVELHPDTTKKISVTLSSTTKVKQESSTDGITHSNLTVGQEYELYYWNGEWQLIDSQIAGDSALSFDAPASALYWLVAKDSDKEERIFTYDNGRQVWW